MLLRKLKLKLSPPLKSVAKRKWSTIHLYIHISTNNMLRVRWHLFHEFLLVYLFILPDTDVFNYQSRSAELDHIQTWAARNNLHLNRAKCVDLIMSEPRHRRQFNLPPCTSDITRVSSLKIFGVTITSKMSVSEHVRSLINSCAQTIYAIRILRSKGMDDVIKLV